jgi:hypothetical protein
MIISNDNERLQDPILLLKIPMGTRKNFSENYRKFGHSLSRMFASPGLELCFNMFRFLICYVLSTLKG